MTEESKTKFKAGDRVVLSYADDRWTAWMPVMSDYVGLTGEVFIVEMSPYDSTGEIMYCVYFGPGTIPYWYRERCLELETVTEISPEPMSLESFLGGGNARSQA